MNLAAALVAIYLGTASAPGAEPTKVLVRFSVVGPWKAYFSTSDQARLSREGAEAVRQSLQPRLPFVRLATDGPATCTLTLRIDKGSSAMADATAIIGLHGELSGECVRASPLARECGAWKGTSRPSFFQEWVDRAVESAVPRTVEHFLSDVTRHLAELPSDWLVGNLMGRVPVCTTAEFRRGEGWHGWILPLTVADLCGGPNSRLVVDTIIRYPDLDDPRSFEGRISSPYRGTASPAHVGKLVALAECEESSDSVLRTLTESDAVRVEGVYLASYIPKPCAQPVAPGDSGLAVEP